MGWRAEIEANGRKFTVDGGGPQTSLSGVELTGWWSTPDGKWSLTERATGDGAFDVADDSILYSARTVELSMWAVGGRSDQIDQMRAVLATAHNVVKLRVIDDNSDTYVTGLATVSDDAGSVLSDHQGITLTLSCPDPRRMSTAAHTAYLSPPRSESMGGLSFALWPAYDEMAGRYTDESISAWLARFADAQAYGCSMPKGLSTTITKLGANSGIPVPTPGTLLAPAVDAYDKRGPFLYCLVNGIVDPDGSPHVTAIEGDDAFALDGSNGDVWTLAPVLWTRQVETDDAVETWVSDAPLPGYRPESDAYLPDGRMRPFILRARYGGVRGADGLMHSYSGRPLWIRDVSHNSLITQTASATTGYSGKTASDDWYVSIMFYMKYATKDFQSVFRGCTVYDVESAPSVAETDVTRVIIPKATAAQLLVGSSVMLGTGNGDGTAVDRNKAEAYDVFDARRVVRTEPVDDATSAVYVEGAAFDTTTGMRLQTVPWGTGATDAVRGDGSPTSNSSGKEPCQIQGIELFYGAYEAFGNVIINSDGQTGWMPWVNHDSRGGKTELDAAVYESCGTPLPSDTTPKSWKYAPYALSAEGLLVPTGAGASQSTGLCDGQYTEPSTTEASREWLSLGSLLHGGVAGLRCVTALNWLGYGRWFIASRVSGNGRSRGVN